MRRTLGKMHQTYGFQEKNEEFSFLYVTMAATKVGSV
jgi:hypothetical protein